MSPKVVGLTARLADWWIEEGIFKTAAIGGFLGPFVVINAAVKQEQELGYHWNLDSPFFAVGAILTGAPPGAFLGATFPFWAPFFLWARIYKWAISSDPKRPPDYRTTMGVR